MKRLFIIVSLLILSTGVLFVPIFPVKEIGYRCFFTLFIADLKHGFYPFSFLTWRESCTVLFGIIAISLLVIRLFKENKKTVLLSTIGVCCNVLVLLIALLGGKTGLIATYIRYYVDYGFCFALHIISIVAMVILVLLPYIHLHRRPSKVEQLEQQVADLQKQVDELKDKD